VVGVLSMAWAAQLGRVDLLVLGLVLVLLPLSAAIAITLEKPWFSVVRVFDSDVVSAGETARAKLTVRNESNRHAPALRWRDSCPAELRTPGFAPLPFLGEHARSSRDRSDTAVVRYTIDTTSRGVYALGPLLVERTDPFGLMRARYPVGSAKPLIVVPRVDDLGEAELDVSRSEGYEHELVKHSIPNADELIAREYRPGDPMRRVHWRATARHDKLMVRQEEPRSNPESWLLLDTDEGATHGRRADAENVRFETAVALAASIGAHLIEQGFVLGVAETAPLQLQGRSGAGRAGLAGLPVTAYDPPAGAQSLLTGLAGIRQRARQNSDPAGVLGAALRRNTQAVPTFAVLVDGDHDELAAVASRGSMGDPAVAFFIGSRPDLREIFEDRGWTCVDADAGERPHEIWRRAGIRSQAHHG